LRKSIDSNYQIPIGLVWYLRGNVSESQRAADVLLSIFRRRTEPTGGDTWLSQALADGDRDRFYAAFSSAGRKLGKSSLGLDDAERDAVRLTTEARLDGWGLDELARVVLLATALDRLPPSAGEELVAECYERADNRERQGVLKALPFLPDGRRFVPLAVDACRTSVQTIFEAIACDNLFPAQHFPDASFFQMVLKALFTGAPVERILGLERRITPELVRMVEGYASERRAAGREVPADIDRVLQMAKARGDA
jgi:hypothetical protein